MTQTKTKPTEKQLTPLEISRKSLESILLQGIAGGNIVRSNPLDYGQLGLRGGEATYESAMNSNEVKKIREDAYKKSKAEGDALGVFGEPAYPTNYDVSVRVMRELEEYKAVIPLKELGDIVKGIAPGFDFTVPAELENYVPGELFPKLARAQAAKESRKKADELTEAEKDAFNVYQLLSHAYNRGLGLRAAQSGYFADLNQAAEKITEKYKKPEKKE